MYAYSRKQNKNNHYYKNDKKILEQIAKEQDRSFNYIANQAIKAYIKRNITDKKD